MRIAIGVLLLLALSQPVLAQNRSLPPDLLPEDATRSLTREGDPSLPKVSPNAKKAFIAAAPTASPETSEAEATDAKRHHVKKLMSEVAALRGESYGEEERLLESLQFERVDALRAQAEANVGSTDPDEPQEAVALRTSLWPIRNIPVSWENPSPTNQQERLWVQQAVRATWERESGIRFTGWGRSTAGSTGIRILINDEGPHCKRLGKYLNGQHNGMVLNFTFNRWCTACRGQRMNSIQWIAVHEFGHALGLAHEQNRVDAPSWCQEQQQGSDGDWYITVYDPNSVMNYCNPRWQNEGRLSRLDIRAIRAMYGPPRSASAEPQFPFNQPIVVPDAEPVSDAKGDGNAYLSSPKPKKEKGNAATKTPKPVPALEAIPVGSAAAVNPDGKKTKGTAPAPKEACPFCNKKLLTD